MSLAAFFDEAVPLLRGLRTAAEVEARLGRSPTGTDALAYYARLQAHHRVDQLGELLPSVRARVASRGETAWPALVAAYLRAHPPAHPSMPHVGAAFAGWVAEADAEGALLASLADWHWTRWTVRHAPEGDGDGLEVRAVVRHWPVDAPTAARRLSSDPRAAIAPAPTAALIWRHEPTGRVRHRTLSLATLAVLWRRQGHPLTGPFADLPAAALADESRRLVDDGVLLLPEEAPCP